MKLAHPAPMAADYAAFLDKLAAGGTYERRADPTIDDIATAIGQIAEGFEKHKADADRREAQLRATVERLETRLSRPGAFNVQGGAASEAPQKFKTKEGKEIPVLTPEQKAVDFIGHGNGAEEFSIAEFARDAVLGSRKAASGPALVPTGLATFVIDRVRAETALVNAGAGTLLISGPTNLARLTTDPTVHQHTEGVVDIVSDIGATAVSLNPKTLATLIPLTNELVSDSANLDAVLTTSLTAAFAAKMDALGFATLLADANIPKSAAGQDPAVWAKVLEAVAAALALNQGLPLAHVSAPADFIARASQLASTSGTWLGKPPALSAMRELQTTGLSAGTAFFGDFGRGCVFALRDELRLEVVRWAKSTSATHLLVAHMRADLVVLQPGHVFKQLKTV